MSNQHKQAVLMFHGIGTADHPLEPGEESYWISWDFFDGILEHCAVRSPQNDMFTFDDGNASDLEAARRMRARNVSGLFFVLVGRLGQPGYLSVDDVKVLMSLGMEVGLHGRDHRDLRKVDDRTLLSEVDDARAELATICNRPVTSLAIPYGAYDRRVYRHLARTDFARIYTSDPGISESSDRFVRRNSIKCDHSMVDIKAMLDDVVTPLARLRRTVMPVIKRSI